MVTPSIVALIPARGSSKRVPRKNIRVLNGHPMLAYSIAAAKGSGIFTEVLVVCDDDETADIAEQYGATARRRGLMPDDNVDAEWIALLFNRRTCEDCYAILRPTSPFRTADTIQRAWYRFREQQPCDSIRAVEPVKQHPGKMWINTVSLLPGGTSDNPAIGSAFQRERLMPLLPFSQNWGVTHRLPKQDFYVPWHSSPTQSLPAIYVQNASLEIGWSYNVRQPSLTVAGTFSNQWSIAGEVIAPFFTQYPEGLDINTEEDWTKAEALTDWLPQIDTGFRKLPPDPPEPSEYRVTTHAKDHATDPYGKPAGWKAPAEYTC